jgi:toxin ParE1/3/4
MKQYLVIVTDDAQTDLEELYDYIAAHDAPAKADALFEKIEHLLQSLTQFPERGAITKELREVGIREYREVYFKPYRVIYRVLDNTVAVHLVVDGRRNMQTLLTRRLLRG